MKKKILFCCYGIGVGGIERCMINLLNAIDYTRYDIDLLPMNPEYGMLPNLKAKVNLLNPADYVMDTENTVGEMRKRKARIADYARYLLFRIRNKWRWKPWKMFHAPDNTYDIAIAYAHTGYVPYYVIDQINARKKYMWHHEGRYVIEKRYMLDKQNYPRFDSNIAVSNGDRDILLEVFPELSNKIKVLYNIVDWREIKTKAQERVLFSKKPDVQQLVTVGRLTHQKGPDILLKTAQILAQDGIPFQWFWIGDGDMAASSKEKCHEYGLEDKVIFEGNQANPYPYIKLCDIYIQPSYYEAYCTTTIEAKVLQKPIVVTDVCGMREQFKHGETALIVGVKPEEIYAAIKQLITQDGLKEYLMDNLKKQTNPMECLLSKYYQLFDE